jgi:hypothetical protein
MTEILVMEYLLSNLKAMSSNPTLSKEREGEKLK